MCIRDSLRTVPNYSSVCPFLLVELKKGQLRALVDSGSARSIISSRVREDLEKQGLLLGSDRSSVVCWTASREILPISRVVSLKIKIECFSWVWRFLVSPALGVDCIVGADFISKSGLVLDIQGHHCYFKFNREVVIPFLGYQGAKGGIQEVVCPDSERDHLTPSQKHALDHLCEQFPTVLTPVSYTHLDVYKRQHVSWCWDLQIISNQFNWNPSVARKVNGSVAIS